MLCSVFSSILTLWLVLTPMAQSATPPPVVLQVSWTRYGFDKPITIKSPRDNPKAKAASDDLDRIAKRLDCLRTVTPHVIWRHLVWQDGRIQVHAAADSAIMANVAMMAARDLFPGWRTAGSGMSQMRTPTAYGWRVKMLLAKPVKRPKKHTGAGSIKKGP